MRQLLEWTIDGASGLPRGLFSTTRRTVHGWIWGVHDDQTGIILHQGRSRTLAGAERVAKIIMGRSSRRALHTRKGLSWVGLVDGRFQPRSISPHPGELLATEFQEPWFSTPARLADELGLSEQTVRDLVAKKIPVTEDLDRRLAAYFCMNPGAWLTMQRRHDAALERAFDCTPERHSSTLARMLAQVTLGNLPNVESDRPRGAELL